MLENRGRGGGLAPFFICYADGCFHCALAEWFNLQRLSCLLNAQSDSEAGGGGRKEFLRVRQAEICKDVSAADVVIKFTFGIVNSPFPLLHQMELIDPDFALGK